jgi:hypothetical protein
MQSLSKFDLISLSICSLFILILSYFYYLGNFTHIQRVEKNSIGRILKIKNSAQIKQPKEFTWSDAANNDFIQKNDSVFVGKDSEVTLIINNQDELTLKENSMLSFNENDSTFDIALQYGEINAAQISQRIEIDICGKKEYISSIDAKDIAIKKSANCHVEAKSKSGQIQFAEQQISSIKQTESSLILSESQYEALPTSESTEPLQITIKPNNPMPQQDEISQLFESYAAPEIAPAIALQDKQIPLKNFVKKPINIFSKPEIAKEDMKKNFYSQDKNSSNLYLRWKNTNTTFNVEDSQFEISQFKNFKKILMTENTVKSSILLKTQLSKGSYYWRVRFKSEQKYSEWSSVAELSIF